MPYAKLEHILGHDASAQAAVQTDTAARSLAGPLGELHSTISLLMLR